jgi:hypothetical protein
MQNDLANALTTTSFSLGGQSEAFGGGKNILLGLTEKKRERLVENNVKWARATIKICYIWKKVEKMTFKRPYIAIFDAKKRHIGHG